MCMSAHDPLGGQGGWTPPQARMPPEREDGPSWAPPPQAGGEQSLQVGEGDGDGRSRQTASGRTG